MKSYMCFVDLDLIRGIDENAFFSFIRNRSAFHMYDFIISCRTIGVDGNARIENDTQKIASLSLSPGYITLIVIMLIIFSVFFTFFTYTIKNRYFPNPYSTPASPERFQLLEMSNLGFENVNDPPFVNVPLNPDEQSPLVNENFRDA